MYSKHFGFEALPFSVTPDPRFFYSTEIYQDVLAGLEHGIDAKSAFIVVTGEVGTGKTTLLRRLMYCSPSTIDYAFVNIHPQLSLPALLRAILKELRVPSSSTDQQCLLEELGSHVLDRFTKGRSVALLFDEAQDLSDEMLQELPVIWNLAIESEKLIPIVLMGQPELDSRLNSLKLRQLGQHVTLWRRLAPFSDDDVGPYIATRLERVGYRGDELFEPAAIERLISRSNGIPRLINNICDNALLRAYRASQYKVTAAMIDEIANQLRLTERPIRPRKKINEVADQWRFIDLSPIADENKMARFAGQSRFVQPPRRDQEILPEKDQPQSGDHSIMDDIEASDAIDESAREDRDQITPSSNDLFVDQPQFVDRWASPDRKSAPEIDYSTEDLETALPAEFVKASNTIDEPPREKRHEGWRRQQLNNVSRLAISIGAVMILIILAWVLIGFYPSQQEASVPLAKSNVENLRREVAAPAKPIDDISAETRIEKPLPRVLASSSPAVVIPEDRYQNLTNPPTTQKIVEQRNAAKIARPASEEIYRVSEASFLRKRPTADSEIVDTLRPGTRVVVTSRSGEYFRVRSLANQKISGFVHKEDAFFERAKK